MVNTALCSFFGICGFIKDCARVREGLGVRVESSEDINHLEIVDQVFPKATLSILDCRVIVRTGGATGVCAISVFRV